MSDFLTFKAERPRVLDDLADTCAIAARARLAGHFPPRVLDEMSVEVSLWLDQGVLVTSTSDLGAVKGSDMEQVA